MKLSWQHVVVIGMVLAAVVGLALAGQDTTALLGLGTLLLAGIGLIAGQQSAIRDNTNGTMAKLLTMVEANSARLAEMSPPDQIATMIDQAAHRAAAEHASIVGIVRTTEEEHPVLTPVGPDD